MFGAEPAAVLLVGDGLDDEFPRPARVVGEGATGDELGSEAAFRVAGAQAVEEAGTLTALERVNGPQAGRARRHRRFGVGVGLEYEAPTAAASETSDNVWASRLRLEPTDLEAGGG